MRRFIKSGYMTACSFTAMLLVIEAASRLIAPTLPVDPGKWPRVEIASKLAQMRDYANEDRSAEVLFVGSSMMAGGVDPTEFTDASGRSSYNAAFAGPSTRTVTPWVLDVVAPLLEPEAVVIGLQTRDMNDVSRKNNKMYRNFINSPGYKQSKGNIASRLEGDLESVSAFLRNRRALREPSQLFAVDQEGEEALAQADLRKVIGPRGMRVEESVTYRPAGGLMERLAQNSLANFTMGGAEFEALVQLEQRLEDRGAELIVLNMPATDDYWPAHEDLQADLELYNDYMRRLVTEYGVTYIDAQDAFPSSIAFRDPIHLDIEGRAALARALGESWQQIEASDGGTFEVRCTDGIAPECEVVQAGLPGENEAG